MRQRQHRHQHGHQQLLQVAAIVVMLTAAPAALTAPAASQTIADPTTARVSVATSGRQANGYSHLGEISRNGRYVAFTSDASNLAAGDNNSRYDAFVRDLSEGTTTIVSVTATGAPAGKVAPGAVAVSAGGRYVAFQSKSSRIVPGDTNRSHDIFVRDMVTGITERISLTTAGEQGNDDSVNPAMSADGRYVSFESYGLTPREFHLGQEVYVHDRETGVTERASVGSGRGRPGAYSSWNAGMSADGRYVAFVSTAENLVAERTRFNHLFVRDRLRGVTRLASRTAAGDPVPGLGIDGTAGISADGRYATFATYEHGVVPEDHDGATDVFVRDLKAGTTALVSVSNTGRQVTRACYEPDISRNGRMVVFQSRATNLVAGDSNDAHDVFVRDTVAHTTRRASVSVRNKQADDASGGPLISANGRHVAFVSEAANLVSGDTNGVSDVFARYLGRR